MLLAISGYQSGARKGMASFLNAQRALHLGITPSYPMSLAALPQLAGRLVAPEGEWPGAQTLVRELVTAHSLAFACKRPYRDHRDSPNC